MGVSRRAFLGATTAAGLAGFVRSVEPSTLVEAQIAQARRVFRHGVASGDPLSDAVILWTRVSAPVGATPNVAWELATDSAFKQIVIRGTATTGEWRDCTVKVDATGLRAATTYYYRFRALGEQSPIGRTKTLPASNAERVRLALASCSNYPVGFFNVYARIAARADLDAVLHLGDYIYEYRERDLRRRHDARSRLAAEPRDHRARRVPDAARTVPRAIPICRTSIVSIHSSSSGTITRSRTIRGARERRITIRIGVKEALSRAEPWPRRPSSSGCRFARIARRVNHGSIGRSILVASRI